MVESVTGTYALARLLQLASPTLPVGAYAYSSGLEYVINDGWVRDEQEFLEWLTGYVEQVPAQLDVPVLCRLYQAWQDNDRSAVQRWSRYLAASRESAELLAEDRHLGIALARLLQDLGVDRAAYWVDRSESCWATLFSLAACEWGISRNNMLQGYLWSYCENQVAAAIKLVPLGQTAGQRILSACGDRLSGWAQSGANLADDELGQFAPAMAMASALHEGQYSRLFRS